MDDPARVTDCCQAGRLSLNANTLSCLKNEDNSGRLVDYPVIPVYINSTMLSKVQCQIRYFLYKIFVSNFVVQKSENVPTQEVQVAVYVVSKPAENSTFFAL